MLNTWITFWIFQPNCFLAIKKLKKNKEKLTDYKEKIANMDGMVGMEVSELRWDVVK